MPGTLKGCLRPLPSATHPSLPGFDASARQIIAHGKRLRNGFAIVTCLGPAASPDLHLTITFRCAPLLLHLKRLAIPNDQGWILLALGTPESKRLTKVRCPA